MTVLGIGRAFFSGKRGAGTHKRGKDKYTESFVTISLYNITSLPTFANFITIVQVDILAGRS
jgi:hypothetical protein